MLHTAETRAKIRSITSAFLCNIEAPGHFIVGNTKNVAHMIFIALKVPVLQNELNRIIVYLSQLSGLPYRKKTFKVDDEKLASVPFTVTYAIFFVLPYAVSILVEGIPGTTPVILKNTFEVLCHLRTTNLALP